jgi:hypothetical protein
LSSSGGQTRLLRPKKRKPINQEQALQGYGIEQTKPQKV